MNTCIVLYTMYAHILVYTYTHVHCHAILTLLWHPSHSCLHIHSQPTLNSYRTISSTPLSSVGPPVKRRWYWSSVAHLPRPDHHPPPPPLLQDDGHYSIYHLQLARRNSNFYNGEELSRYCSTITKYKCNVHYYV